MTPTVASSQTRNPSRLQREKKDDARTRIPAAAVAALEAALKSQIEGEVRFDAGSRALYATDGSNYRQVPIGVVIPRSIEDVSATVRLAREYGVCPAAGAVRAPALPASA